MPFNFYLQLLCNMRTGRLFTTYGSHIETGDEVNEVRLRVTFTADNQEAVDVMTRMVEFGRPGYIITPGLLAGNHFYELRDMATFTFVQSPETISLY